jgi:hypothetical protein
MIVGTELQSPALAGFGRLFQRSLREVAHGVPDSRGKCVAGVFSRKATRTRSRRLRSRRPSPLQWATSQPFGPDEVSDQALRARF